MKKFFTLFAAMLFASSMFAVYNLTKVTSVADGKLYVFERNSRVLIGSVASQSKLKSTDEYSKVALTGTELYVWKLDAIDGDAANGYCIINMGKYSEDPNGHTQLSNASGDSKLVLANASTSAWVFEFTDGVALISNKANSNRFIGETENGSGEYKAYAASNLNTYGHDFTVYELQESSDPYVGVSAEKVDFGTVKKDASVAAKEVTVSFANLTGAVTFSGLTTPFSAEGTLAASGDKITISASTAVIGDYSQTLTVQSAADSKSATVTVTMKVVEAADPSASFELFTGALEEGDYVICSGNNALNTTETSNRLGSTAVTPENDVISGPDAAIVWHIAKSGDYWTIYNAEANKFAAAKDAKNQAQMLASGTDDKALWKVTVSNGKFDFENKARAASSSDPNNKWLRYNSQVSNFACYASGTGSALSLYKKGVVSAVAKPVIEGKENFTSTVAVKITCATDGAEIFYTLDGTEPTKDATKYTAEFELNATTTVKAIAIKGDDKSSVATKTFTKVELANCAAVYALNDNDVTELGEVVVTYAVNNDKNVWVKDASGALLVYFDAKNTTLKAGDRVTGIVGTKTTYKGLVELKPTVEVASMQITAGEAPEPEVLTSIDKDADMSKYVRIEGIEVEGSFTQGTASNINISVAGATVIMRNNFKDGFTFAAGKKYDIVGIVTYYDALQLYFLSATESATTAVENATVAGKAQKVIRDGQLYIIRDGAIFNANGVVVK